MNQDVDNQIGGAVAERDVSKYKFDTSGFPTLSIGGGSEASVAQETGASRKEINVYGTEAKYLSEEQIISILHDEVNGCRSVHEEHIGREDFVSAAKALLARGGWNK